MNGPGVRHLHKVHPIGINRSVWMVNDDHRSANPQLNGMIIC